MDQSDIDLLQAWRIHGDRAALECLIARHIPAVHRLLTRMSGSMSTADDLTQDVFLRATRSLTAFDGNSQFATWLIRIALNVAYSHLERNADRMTQTLDDHAPPCARSSDGPVSRAVSKERLERVDAALARLAPKRRAVVVLVCLEGRSVADAAAIERCPPRVIHSRLHEARKQLKELLKDLLT